MANNPATTHHASTVPGANNDSEHPKKRQQHRPGSSAEIPSGALQISKPQAAALMQVSVRTFERMMALDLVPGTVRLPGSRTVRFRREILEEWIRQGCPVTKGKRTGR